MKKSIKHYVNRFLKFIIISIAMLIILGYLLQEKILFHPKKLSADYTFDFPNVWKETYFPMSDGVRLNALFFPADSIRKGAILYLHGNAGNLAGWGYVSQAYTSLGYDVWIIDYRGFGKSEGKITNQKRLMEDVNTIYQSLAKVYKEDNMIVIGYSIGTGLAAEIASKSRPKMLLLQAPYYSMKYLAHDIAPFVPSFLLKYPLPTNVYLKTSTTPCVIFHGDQDELIHLKNSILLQKDFKASDTLIILKGQGHNGMTDNPDYLKALEFILK